MRRRCSPSRDARWRASAARRARGRPTARDRRGRERRARLDGAPPRARRATAGQAAFTLLAHGVDHGLRDDAARELDLARALADSLGVSLKTTRRGRRAAATCRAARRARYEVLDGVARRAGGLLATAHHADDRAETVLLRILRGASVAGLAVLPARAGQRIRPFVRARREAIEAHVKRHAIAFADDPSNEDPRFMRTRVRRDVLPLLASLDAGIVEHLAGIADDAAAQAAPWGALPRATRDALEKLASTESTRARVILPGGRVARFDGDTAAIVVDEAADEPSRPILDDGVQRRCEDERGRDRVASGA
ncbi:MAG: tRNA lysidine(34) synthetase TilS [Polyangiaceae bacterium]